MKKSGLKIERCGFCLAFSLDVDEAIKFFSAPTTTKVDEIGSIYVRSICNRCVCFLQSLDTQTLGRDEDRHKPFADIERVAYGIFREPQANGISFKCGYCAKTESRLVFVAPDQDICVECVDHFNSH